MKRLQATDVLEYVEEIIPLGSTGDNILYYLRHEDMTVYFQLINVGEG